MTEMLSCSDVQERYTDFFENNLSTEEHRQVEQHLHECPPCQAIFNQLSAVLRKLRNLPPVSTSSDFNQKLLNRIHESEQTSVWQRLYSAPVVRMGSYAAAAGLVLALLFTQWMEPGQQFQEGIPAIANNPQDDIELPVLAERSDSVITNSGDSLNLKDPSNYIDPNKLQLVNDKR